MVGVVVKSVKRVVVVKCASPHASGFADTFLHKGVTKVLYVKV